MGLMLGCKHSDLGSFWQTQDNYPIKPVALTIDCNCSGYLVGPLLQWQSIPAAIKFMLNALAVTSLYYSMGVASRTATPTSVYMYDIALTESSKHTWIFFTVICGRGGGWVSY